MNFQQVLWIKDLIFTGPTLSLEVYTTQVTLSPFYVVFFFFTDSSAFIPHVIYFKRKFLSIKTLICLLPILHFTGTHRVVVLMVVVPLPAHLLVPFFSSVPLSFFHYDPLNSGCVFFLLYLFFFLSVLFSLVSNFKIVEIQFGYIREKRVSLMYLKLRKNSRIDLSEFPQIRIYLLSFAVCFKWASVSYLVDLLQMTQFDDNLKT